MVKVKICGVTSVADALLAAAAGADAVGLNFHPPSPRCVSDAAAEEIAAALPAAVWRVGVFVDAARERVRERASRLALDALQFHGGEGAAYCRGWPQKVIKAVRVRGPGALAAAAAEYAVDFLLADAYVEGVAGGTGRRLPPAWLEGVSRERLILAGGLDAGNVAEAVRRVRPAWVDVASGVESAPGRKDPQAVRRFVVHAKNA
jgi:phosphoribosylanthranilate isomerase